MKKLSKLFTTLLILISFQINAQEYFMDGIEELREKGTWNKDDIIKLYFGLLPEFAHKETGKYLDQRM